MDHGRSTHAQKGGVGQYLTYMGVSLSFHTNPATQVTIAISFSLKHVG